MSNSCVNVSGRIPPQSATEYSLQLDHAVNDLGDLTDDLQTDVFLLYCTKNVPKHQMSKEALHPERLRRDLERKSVTWYDMRNFIKIIIVR